MKCPKCGSEMVRDVRATGINLETGQLESEEFSYCPKGCGHEEKLKDGEG
jgi:predicted nucleic-acid-binding Zn-ribbon protein